MTEITKRDNYFYSCERARQEIWRIANSCDQKKAWTIHLFRLNQLLKPVCHLSYGAVNKVPAVQVWCWYLIPTLLRSLETLDFLNSQGCTLCFFCIELAFIISNLCARSRFIQIQTCTIYFGTLTLRTRTVLKKVHLDGLLLQQTSTFRWQNKTCLT